MKKNQKDSLLSKFEKQAKVINLSSITGGEDVTICSQVKCGSDDVTILDTEGQA